MNRFNGGRQRKITKKEEILINVFTVQFNAKPRQTTAHAQQLTTPKGLYPRAFTWVLTGCNNNNNADKYTVDK